MSFTSFQADQNTSYFSYRTPSCNLCNPVEYFANSMQDHHYQFELNARMMVPDYNLLSSKAKLELAFRIKAKAKQYWKDEYSRLGELKLADELLALLEEKKKKVQQKLLTGITFNTDILISLPIQAWQLFRMPYSRLISEYQAKELEGRVYPAMMYLKDDGEFDYVGATDLTPAEMRVAIQRKHRVICDFIGNEDYWHCFFRTESGIKGKEAPHIGQPHLHYISSAWGISRHDIISNLSSYRYSLKCETIMFKRNR